MKVIRELPKNMKMFLSILKNTRILPQLTLMCIFARYFCLFFWGGNCCDRRLWPTELETGLVRPTYRFPPLSPGPARMESWMRQFDPKGLNNGRRGWKTPYMGMGGKKIFRTLIILSLIAAPNIWSKNFNIQSKILRIALAHVWAQSGLGNPCCWCTRTCR